MTLLISEQDIENLLSFEVAVPVAEEAFRMAGEKSAINPARTRMPFDKGFLQFGSASLQEKRVMGFKFWANFGGHLTGAQRQVWNYLYHMDSHELLAIIQAYAIGKFRTSAVSAIAAKYLSPANASTLGLYGSGKYAEGQLTAITKVRPIKSAKVYSRNPDKRAEFCKQMSEKLGIEVIPASKPEEAAQAEIVVTMTTSELPVLMGDWLPPACLVIAAGANHWYERELDGRAINRAKFVVVDEMEQAKVECGDILWAVAHGQIAWNQVEEFGGVVSGRIRPPDFGSGIILFESQGIAIQDIAISLAAYDLAKQKGIGRDIAF